MAATTLRPAPPFPDESGPLHSFTPPTRPSLEASSMKSRKSLLNILGSARRVAAAIPSVSTGSKLKQEVKPPATTSKASTSNTKGVLGRDTMKKSPLGTTSKTEIADPTSNSSQRQRSKSRTILRAISTTFRSRSPVTPTSPSPADISLQTKQNREAALRERGLLPPLRPKDLSRQEAEQDRNIPVLPTSRNSSDSSNAPSAADLIKREWEAKNKPTESAKVVEQDRMKSFRFGGTSNKAPEQARDSELETVAEVKTPQPSPTIVKPLPIPTQDKSQKMASHQSSSSAEYNRVGGRSGAPPSTPLLTPPPTPSKLTSPKPVSTTSTPDHPPSSFQPLRRSDVESSSTSSNHNRSGSRTSTSSAPISKDPAISWTPLLPINTNRESLHSASSAASAPHRRSDSLTQMPSISESGSSVRTPSLDPSSPTTTTATTISTLNTTESLAVIATGANNIGFSKGKNNTLKIKTPEHNIPMIIECPVEDGLVAESLSGEIGTIPEKISIPLSPISEAHSPTSLAVPPSNLVPIRRGREFADPERRGTKSEKRKSFNPFKKDQPQGRPAEPNIDQRRPSTASSLKRLSVSASLTNIRRAASNFTRPKSMSGAAVPPPRLNGSGGKMFDASHLPPSPTLPSHIVVPDTDAGENAGEVSSVVSRPRRAIDPRLHSRGSILMEASAIQDDEVRRMTELAFLG